MKIIILLTMCFSSFAMGKPFIKQGTILKCSSTNKNFAKLTKDVYRGEIVKASSFKQVGYFSSWSVASGQMAQPTNCQGISGDFSLFYTTKGWIGNKNRLLYQIAYIDSQLSILNKTKEHLKNLYTQHKTDPSLLTFIKLNWFVYSDWSNEKQRDSLLYEYISEKKRLSTILKDWDTSYASN